MTDFLLLLDMDPGFEEARRFYAELCIRRGNYAQALRLWDELVQENPEEPGGYFQRARLHGLMEAPQLALLDLTQCIHLNPGHVDAFALRAALLCKAAPKRALRDWSIVLLLDAGTQHTTNALLHRGILYAHMHRNVRASAAPWVVSEPSPPSPIRCAPCTGGSHGGPFRVPARRRAALHSDGVGAFPSDDQSLLPDRAGLPPFSG